jgi:hypothetical protein
VLPTLKTIFKTTQSGVALAVTDGLYHYPVKKFAVNAMA